MNTTMTFEFGKGNKLIKRRKGFTWTANTGTAVTITNKGGLAVG